jgi:gliding motility-associated-like protein
VKSVEILVPKAFTPNRDGKNDYLRPILLGVKQLNYFKIFNRWGQVIFETRNDQPGWDGRLKGILQSSQVFVWVAEGVGVDNRVYIKKGTSVLIR